MEKQSEQHFQASKEVIKNTDLSLNDIAVYLKIGKYMNKDTREAFPSLQTIADETKLSIPTVRTCIKKLETAEAIQVTRKGRLNRYLFLKHELFEKFGHKFLNNENLSAQEMAFVAKMQPEMFIDGNLGTIKCSNFELAEMTELSISTIKRYNKNLETKGFASIENGNKTYYLDELGQFVICAIKNLNDRVTELENKELSDRDIDRIARRVVELQNEQTIVL